MNGDEGGDPRVPARMTVAEREALAEATVAAWDALGNHGLYGRGAIRPEKFPSSNYQNWLDWKKHFTWIVEANEWTDQQARSALPTCLTSWALDEFCSMPRQYRERQLGHPNPSLERMFQFLDPLLTPYRNQRTARAEFKNLYQQEKEGIREFSRRVRALGEIAQATSSAANRDEHNREQFLEGLFDADVQEQLYREDPATFADAVNRAQALEALNKGARLRQRRRISSVRFAQESNNEAAGPSTADTTRVAVMNVEDRMSRQEEKMDNLLTSLQSLTDLMGKMVTRAVPANPEEVKLEGKQSFSPARQENRYGNNFNDNRGNVDNRVNKPRGGLGGCFICQDPTHFARDCPHRQSNSSSSNPLNF